MAQPLQSEQPQRKKELPAEPIIPRLSEQTVRSRASAVFDASTRGLFIPKSENIDKEVDDYLEILKRKLIGMKPNEENLERAYASARAEYTRRNPGSSLTYFFKKKEGGENIHELKPRFVFDTEGGRIKAENFKFAQSNIKSFKYNLKKHADKEKDDYARAKKKFVTTVVRAAAPSKEKDYASATYEHPTLLSAAQFSSLYTKLRSDAGTDPKIPVKVAMAKKGDISIITLEYIGKKPESRPNG